MGVSRKCFILLTLLAVVLSPAAARATCTLDAECADTNACTANERCDAGDCASDPVDCDDGNVCTVDACDVDSGCQHTAQPNGLSCSDGNVCTGEEVCQGGNCSNPSDLDCNDGNACTSDSCAPPNGCRNTPVAGCCTIDADCADASACTTNERCTGGLCVSDPVDCDDGNVCTSDSCSQTLGCRNIPVVNGIACGDGDVCNGVESCQSGACATGTPLACNDGNACTVDACDSSAGCTTQQLPGCCDTEADCIDVSACTVQERCEAQSCVSDALPCDDGNPCSTDGCNPASGCTYTPVPNGQTCGDLDFCNGFETCQAGSCAPGVGPLCDDGNPCTVDDCNSSTGCTHTAVPGCCFTDGDCVDGDACTVSERCVSGACTSQARNCLDGNPCTQDTCLPTDGCLNLPFLDGTSCSDNKACDGFETCGSGICRDGTPPDCDDRNFCTTDSCSNATGCGHSPVGGCCNIDVECADADLCTIGERCLASHSCQSQPRNCTDGNPCTSDGCSPSFGCFNNPASGPCNDGVPCTTADACNAGACSGLPVACDDGNYCDGAEACVPATGVCATSGTLPCSPGGRNPLKTCAAEWYVVNPANPDGALAKLHSCVEGDPTCDADADPESCTFQVSACLHVTDPRLTPTCQSPSVSGYELPRGLLRRTPGIASALRSALDSLPGAELGGMFSNLVTFTPPIDAPSCTPLFNVPVPLGKRVTIKGKAITTTGSGDKDRLKFSCRAS